MAIYRGPGGAGDATNDATSQAILAAAAANQAAASATSAAASATAASTSATNAATSATNAAANEANVASNAANAATSATNAAASAATATTKASEAATSATDAAASATSAATSATNASNSATSAAGSASTATTKSAEASTSATNAASSATAAAASAITASTQATDASNSATAAATSATNAANSATAAATSATNAANSVTTATTQASNAASSATAAATSASNASTSATNASNSASSAATSATNASNSASAASTSATNAANSASAAAASYDSFDDRYLGSKSSAPTLDNDGNALLIGALYFDTTSNSMKVYNGTSWLDAYASLSGALLAANNLSDVASASSARANLGLGTAATTAATDYATAAQGTKADTAYGWGNHASAGYAADSLVAHLAGTEIITGAKTFSSSVTLSGGTANGVAYLNGSKVLTTGSALTFDGTTFTTTGSATAAALIPSGATVPTNGLFLPAANTVGCATNSAERMRIDSSGNLLVGTTSLNGGIPGITNNIGTATTRNTGAAAGKFWKFPYVDTNNGCYIINHNNAGVYIADGATSWTANSDERMKTEIIPFENAVAKVSSLRAGTGRYLTDEEGVSRSFLIAQDVQKVLPEAVNVQNDEQGTLGLQYTDVIPLLVAAIKELKAELDATKAEVAALKGK